MKNHFHFHFYIRIFILAILGLAFSFLITKANIGPGGGLEVQKFKFNGWAWSPNIGWVSLNCYNDFDGDGQLTAADNKCDTVRDGYPGLGTVDYALYLDTSNDETVRAVGGCAWAGNVGWWICFDEPGADVTEAPEYGVYLNNYYNGNMDVLDPEQGSVENSLYHGDSSVLHASILALEEVAGWSWELGFPISTSGALPEFARLEGCFNCSEYKECTTELVSCVDDGDCAIEGDTCDWADNICANCLEYKYDVDGGLDSVKSGYSCDACDFDADWADNICPQNSYENNLNICDCSDVHTTPGLIVDYTTSANDGFGSMCGWGWNQYDCGGPDCNGIGWLQFSPRITAFNNPYFSVDSGNIYAKGSIRAKYALPPDMYNAYIVEAGGDIYQIFASSTTDGLGTLPNRSLINFPTLNAPNGHYINALGHLDFNGLTGDINSSGKNKYGATLGGQNPDLSDYFDNEIYHLSGGLGLPGVTIKAGHDGDKQSIIVVIEGDFSITGNISYEVADVDKLSEVASVVWIVKGDVNIDPTVTEVSGTFIVLGNGGDCSVPAAGCGQFITGDGDQELKVYGSVLARRFDLQRTYSDDGLPAEKFINDGRLQINPPSGLEDFSQAIPSFNYNSQ